MKECCEDCPFKNIALGYVPEHSKKGRCMLVFLADYYSDAPVLVDCTLGSGQREPIVIGVEA